MSEKRYDKRPSKTRKAENHIPASLLPDWAKGWQRGSKDPKSPISWDIRKQGRQFELVLDPGNASVDDIAELLSALDALAVACGESGLTFSIGSNAPTTIRASRS